MKSKKSPAVVDKPLSPNALAAWNTIRLAYNQGFFHDHTPPKDRLSTCSGEGSLESPFTFPNAKKPPVESSILFLFHPEFLKRMDMTVIYAILAVPSIKHAPVKDMLTLASGERQSVYRLDPVKQQQLPYDRFFRSIHRTAVYQDRFFDGSPRKLTPETIAYILSQPDEIYIFGMTSLTEIYVLPRTGLVQINGSYFNSWHTHTEFLKEGEDFVYAAGSIKGAKFNLRTGHFLLHELPAIERAAIIKIVDKVFFEALHPDTPYDASTIKDRQLSYEETYSKAIGDSRGEEGLSERLHV